MEAQIGGHPGHLAESQATLRQVEGVLDDFGATPSPLNEVDRVITELGSGGMGKVYLAEVDGRAPGLEAGCQVALKVIHPHLLETPGFFKRFLREAEIGKAVEQDNVVRYFDCDALGVDWTTDLATARKYVDDKVALQGNLDPATLRESPEIIRQGVADVLESYGNGPGHVFNLGHGITPDIDPDHLGALIDAVHELSPQYHK